MWVKLKIGYDGTLFYGWQRQATVRSVQQTLEEAIQKWTGETVSIIAAGRTDSGVHALGQVVSFDFNGKVPAKAFVLGLNPRLPDDLRILSAEYCTAPFNARMDAKAKTYEYHFTLGERVHPITARYSWNLWEKIDIDQLRAALPFFVGRHNFLSLCAADSDSKTFERTIYEIHLEPIPLVPTLYRLRVRGDGFLKQMIRNLVGTAIEVGRGRKPPEWIPELLAAKDRRLAGQTAPAKGLFLAEVEYDLRHSNGTETVAVDRK